jgi:hypothetical protein
MEYVTYILIILGVMALCLAVFGRKGDFVSTKSGKPFPAGSKQPGSVEAQAKSKSTPENRLNVPTPWGWPGNGSVVKASEDHDLSETLHRFVDHLIAEKQTVEDRGYLLKRDESLRLLIEDRYGKSVGSGSGSAHTKKNAAGIPIVVKQRELKEIRTPWGW